MITKHTHRTNRFYTVRGSHLLAFLLALTLLLAASGIAGYVKATQYADSLRRGVEAKLEMQDRRLDAVSSPTAEERQKPPTPSGGERLLFSGGTEVYATVTAYQAVAGQTDATPCIGAMPRVNFCDPPFPIVANNYYKLGTKVVIRGVTYTVADRMAPRFGRNHFDILTDGATFKWSNEPVTIL